MQVRSVGVTTHSISTGVSTMISRVSEYHPVDISFSKKDLQRCKSNSQSTGSRLTSVLLFLSRFHFKLPNLSTQQSALYLANIMSAVLCPCYYPSIQYFQAVIMRV